jgi:hypothetical protein
VPIIYLKHPRHGEKIASSEMEAEYDEQNGWQRYTLDEPDEPADEPVAVNHMLGRRRRKEPEHVHDSR